MLIFDDLLVAARKELIREKDQYLSLTLANADYIEISNEIPAAIPAYDFKFYTRYGIAAVILTSNTGVPLVGQSTESRLVKIYPIRLGFEINSDELDLAEALGQNPVTDQLRIVRDGLDQKLDIVAYSGTPGTTLQGLATQPNVTTLNFQANGNQNGATNSASWSNKTPIQVLADLNTFALKVPEQTALTKSINRILMPASTLLYLQSTPYNESTGESIMSVYLKNQAVMPNGGVNQLIGHPVLENLSSTNGKLMIGYNSASKENKLHIPKGGDFRDFPAELRGTKYTVPCGIKTAGIECRQPQELVYANLA